MSESKPPEDTAASGSRWEDPEANAEETSAPTDAPPTDPPPTAETAAAADEQALSEPLEPNRADPYAASATEPAPPANKRFAWLGTKAALIGGAVALALATGLIGFGIGNAVSDDGTGGRSGERGHHRDGGFGGEQGDRPERGDMRGDSDTDSGSDAESSSQG